LLFDCLKWCFDILLIQIQNTKYVIIIIIIESSVGDLLAIILGTCRGDYSVDFSVEAVEHKAWQKKKGKSAQNKNDNKIGFYVLIKTD